MIMPEPSDFAEVENARVESIRIGSMYHDRRGFFTAKVFMLQVNEQMELKAQLDAAMLAHIRDWIIAEVRINGGPRPDRRLVAQALYPEHADRLLEVHRG